MKHPVILDACTIINLLRIDEDEFLCNFLTSLNLHIASLVYSETQLNYKKNKLSKEQEKYINQVLPQFLVFSHEDDVIIKDLTIDYFEKLKSLVKHGKKNNGELLSSALSLCVSREEKTKVFFYTDDMPAKNQLMTLFDYMQIGSIGDSVDLLLFLYWTQSDFKIDRLGKFLQDLRSEFNLPLKEIISKIQNKKDNLTLKGKKDRVFVTNIDNIIYGYNNADIKRMTQGFEYFADQPKYQDINNIIKEYSNVIKDSHLSEKTASVIKKLRELEIFKIA